jgi:hypothetical protein
MANESYKPLQQGIQLPLFVGEGWVGVRFCHCGQSEAIIKPFQIYNVVKVVVTLVATITNRHFRELCRWIPDQVRDDTTPSTTAQKILKRVQDDTHFKNSSSLNFSLSSIHSSLTSPCHNKNYYL